VRVSFLIPAFNEARTIGEVIDRIGALELESQVIVVDDGSTDGTADIAEAKGALVVRQRNQGKGAAIRPTSSSARASPAAARSARTSSSTWSGTGSSRC
jgi:cellulose synthase/poly-beta-1,6-N-acetylglucosamine synthase-like glycosyltransferase